MYFRIATLAFLAYTGLTSAASTCQKTPSSDTPSANTLAIYTPGQNQVVPVDRPFTITWDPTAGISTVSIVLLQGPSTNVVPLSCIVNSAPNTGNFVWTPASSLNPTGNSGYGLQIIDDTTGKFQYSTQFGISNPDIVSSSSSSSSSSSTASPATQLSDGQVQIPTSSSSSLTTPTHSSTHHTKSQFTTTSSPSSHSSILVLPSSGFPSPTKNSTTTIKPHSISSSSSKHQPIGTIISGGGTKNATHFVTPTRSLTKPSSLGPVTSVVVAQTSAAVQVASSSTSATSPATTTTSRSAAAGVGRRVVVNGGVVAGLGGLVAVLL